MRKLTQEEYFSRCNDKHNFEYDYSKAIYINRRTKIEIGCKKHGYFWQEAGAHLHGSNGCPICANNLKYSFEDFFKKANIVHKNKFKYIEKSNDFDNRKTIEIECPKHGVFKQKPYSHLTGKGCNKCAIEGRILSNEEFLKRAELVHNKEYSYPNLNYKNCSSKIDIECKRHGIFKQSPHQHLSGRGCPKCFKTSSKLEKEILKFVRSICKVVKSTDRDLLGNLELDILIPEHKLAIEVNGQYWHYVKEGGRKKHVLKSKLCKEKGYTLLHLREDLWKKDPEKMKQVIKTLIYR